MPTKDKHEVGDHLKFCTCGHSLSEHVNGGDCLHVIDPKTAKYCKCKKFVLREEPAQRRLEI